MSWPIYFSTFIFKYGQTLQREMSCTLKVCLKDILAPNKFTKSLDVVAVSEELLAEGMVGHPPRHQHSKDLVGAGGRQQFRARFSPVTGVIDLG